ncbi:MAG TPA: RIO1 family regulatory kinase/ATPase [Methanoregulaceae archaeon]|nr:MAG: serine/threonine protein phosphatase [Methanolinea sp.]HON81553.1 RIO1 family regulatory kinase/ATPase [Methanoregulaceae archaeon]HPD10360.1 RIO1 family regulatory kinase/ATPase [Methanoregulaceae archaeon]HRT15411.1 RIO1 family regulatory kinase/ATPase [Methanoregulaceae archaeon]HRU30884.1 RIO1 family regulatory kinase/ATPase [Methanoregulaceae archaeon]
MGISADTIRGLHRYEIRILMILERLMRRYRWVPLDTLRRTIGLSESEVSYRLGRMMAMGLVRFDAVPYEGYSLIFQGYDALALISLSRKGTVQALGPLIGEGKEAVVYGGLGLSELALKFHHVGQRSFQSPRVKREYMPEEGHCPWIFASRLSAEREFEALRTLHPAVSVPLPVDINRHTVVMEYIPGATLNRCTLESPKEVLSEILENVRLAYGNGIIHADLSEFNVMHDGSRVYLIDWPQWVGIDHPNAAELLVRDIGNITRYFTRRYGTDVPADEALGEVTG